MSVRADNNACMRGSKNQERYHVVEINTIFSGRQAIFSGFPETCHLIVTNEPSRQHILLLSLKNCVHMFELSGVGGGGLIF